jgi:hypothetical protein
MTTREQLDELEKLTKPIADWIAKNKYPYGKVTITMDEMWLHEMEAHANFGMLEKENLL